MDVLIAMNDAFVKCYQVMMTSLCANNSGQEIIFHIPHTDGLTKEGLNALRETARANNAAVRDYYFTEDRLGDMNRLPLGMWSVEMFFRLFAQDFVEVSKDRILWLDGDIIVNGSIAGLYEQDFGDNYYIACEDTAISRGKIKEEYDNLGWDGDRIYYNSGVLLINVAGLKNDGITKNMAAEFALANIEKLHYPDQYILNALFHDRIKEADALLYNCQVSGYPYTMGRQILSESVILHFPGYRPWQTDYQKHYSSAIPGDIWWKYARMCGRGEGFLKWKILNTIKVKPWQAAYRLSKTIKSKKRK